MLSVDVVVFDFDGTLVDSNQIKSQSFFDVTKEFRNSKEIIESIQKEHANFTRYEIFDAFVNELKNITNKKEVANKLTNRYSSLCEEKIAKAPEIEGASFVLKELSKKDKRLFISSATPVLSLLPLVKRRGFIKYMEDIFGAPQKKEKHLETIIENFQCPKSKIVYIGDSEQDRIAAEHFDCHFIGVGSSTERFRSPPKIMIPNLLGLKGILL